MAHPFAPILDFPLAMSKRIAEMLASVPLSQRLPLIFLRAHQKGPCNLTGLTGERFALAGEGDLMRGAWKVRGNRIDRRCVVVVL